MNADHGVKCKSEKRGVNCEKSDAKYPAIHFSFFAFRDRFRIFYDKCIAGPVTLVLKKRGPRFYVDYQKLKVTIKNSYPMARIDYIFDLLNHHLAFGPCQ